MSAVWGALIVFAVAMLLIAGAVFGLNDSSILTAPPEAIAEGFVRQLASRRYERALPYLDDELKASTGAGELRALAERLTQQAGEIIDVYGERSWMAGDRAEAVAVVETKSAGTLRLSFPLSRKQGAWAISGLGPLEQTSNGIDIIFTLARAEYKIAFFREEPHEN